MQAGRNRESSSEAEQPGDERPGARRFESCLSRKRTSTLTLWKYTLTGRPGKREAETEGAPRAGSVPWHYAFEPRTKAKVKQPSRGHEAVQRGHAARRDRHFFASTINTDSRERPADNRSSSIGRAVPTRARLGGSSPLFGADYFVICRNNKFWYICTMY